MRSILSKPAIRNKDLQILHGMYQNILKFENENLSLTERFINVSDASGGANGLSFNDYKDAEDRVIRNQYGYVKRNKKREENPNRNTRIDFEVLFRVKALIEAGYQIPVEFKTDLTIMKAKLEKILVDEGLLDSTLLLQPVIGNDADLDNIKHWVQTHYGTLLLQRLQKEAQELASIEIVDHISFYAIARKFTIMGELLHDGTELYPDQKKTKKTCLFAFFEKLNNLRNGFIHRNIHRTLIRVFREENPNQELQSYIHEFVIALSELCQSATSLQDENLNQDTYKRARKNLGEFLGCISAKSKIRVRDKLLDTIRDAQVYFKIIHSRAYQDLANLLIPNTGIFKSEAAKQILELGLRKNSPGQLLRLEACLEELDEPIKSELQIALAQFKNTIQTLNFNNLLIEFKTLLQDENVKTYLSNKYGEDSIPGITIEQLTNDLGSLLESIKAHKKAFDKDFSIKAIGISEDEKCAAKKLADILQRILNTARKPLLTAPNLTGIQNDFKNKKPMIKILKAEDAEELEYEFDFEIIDDNEALIQDFDTSSDDVKIRSKNALGRFARLMGAEMQLLQDLHGAPKSALNKWVIEHIVTIVGQHTRDVEEMSLSRNLFLSRTSEEAAVEAKNLRSKGLAHEVMVFNEDNFLERLQFSILPSIEDFSAIHMINDYRMEILEQHPSLFCGHLGWAYAQVNRFDEAVIFYKQALKMYQTEMPADDFTENSPVDKHRLENFGITNPNAILVDAGKHLFGHSSFDLHVFSNLLNVYEQLSNLDAAIATIQDFEAKLDEHKLIGYFRSLSTEPVVKRLSEQTGQQLSVNLLGVINNPEEEKKYEIEYEEAFNSLLARIDTIKRPFVLCGIEPTYLFESISNIYLFAGRLALKRDELDRAFVYLQKALNYCYHSNITSSSGLKHCLFMTSREHAATVFFEFAKYHYRKNDFNTAAALCNNVEDESKPDLQLAKLIFVSNIERRKGKMHKATLEEYLQILESKKIELKTLATDRFFEFYQQYYIQKLIYFAFNRQTTKFIGFFQEIRENFPTLSEGLILEEALPDFLRQVGLIFSGLLEENLSHTKAKSIRDTALAFLKYCEEKLDNMSIRKSEIAKNCSFALSKYAEHYFIAETIETLNEKIHYSEQVLQIQEKYDVNTNVSLCNLMTTYISLTNLNFASQNIRQACDSINKVLYYIEKLNINDLSKDSCEEITMGCGELMQGLNLNKAFIAHQVSEFMPKFDHIKAKLRFYRLRADLQIQALSHHVNVYRTGTFFSYSRFATETQPYGPYEDYYSMQDTESSQLAKKCSNAARALSKF